jgi:hypothetical protein
LDATANATSRQFYLQVPDSPPILFNPIVNASQFSVPSESLGPFAYYAGWDIFLYQDQTISSPLGPLVNALELLELSENMMAKLTNPKDALTIEEIKLSYNLTDWTGDPCLPFPHAWIACSYGSNSVPSIIEV